MLKEDKMDQHRAIKIIETVYPGDRDLLEKSKLELFGWQYDIKNLAILYAELCRERENQLRYRSLHR